MYFTLYIVALPIKSDKCASNSVLAVKTLFLASAVNTMIGLFRLIAFAISNDPPYVSPIRLYM